ncbi:MAG: putative lipid II flippase FtsW [Treponemataceae bacterium]|nr:MAG: putative lipid II flippase FtsW [Treponemataceae bacterium]
MRNLSSGLLATSPIDIDGNGRIDALLIVVIILMWGLGVFTLNIASSGAASKMFDDSFYFVKRQFIFSALGLATLLLFTAVPTATIRKALPAIVFLSFVLCFLVFVPGLGIERNGAKRWLKLPFFGTLQPSETAKLAVVLFLANMFAKQKDEDPDAVISVSNPIIGLLTFVIMVLFQKDFSTAMFLLCLGIILFFAVGMRIGWFLSFCILAIPALMLFIFMEPYRVNRLIAFVRPDYDLHGLNYQTNMSRLAIGAGGFWGEGVGSNLTRIGRVPEIQADYIFSGWAEAMGFAGVIMYFVILFLFAWRGFRAAFLARERFTSFAAFGCTLSIVFQAIINCGVVCSAFPSTGMPLPFFSSGGSSLLITCAMCGIILQASRSQKGAAL